MDDTQDPNKKPNVDVTEDNSETTEIDIAPSEEIMTTEQHPDESMQEPSEEEMKKQEDHVEPEHSHGSAPTDDSVPSTWIKLENGKFKCSECENEVEPETNTIEGVVKADLDQIKSDLKQYSTKVIYGICPVCGMEFVFRLKGDDLYLEPSDLEK